MYWAKFFGIVILEAVNFCIAIKYYLLNEFILALLVLFDLRPQKVENWGKVAQWSLSVLSNPQKYQCDSMGLHEFFHLVAGSFMHNFSCMKICRLLFFK